jgi:hypothetical protein
MFVVLAQEGRCAFRRRFVDDEFAGGFAQQAGAQGDIGFFERSDQHEVCGALPKP